jgi:hypothetical protein
VLISEERETTLYTNGADHSHQSVLTDDLRRRV